MCEAWSVVPKLLGHEPLPVAPAIVDSLALFLMGIKVKAKKWGPNLIPLGTQNFALPPSTQFGAAAAHGENWGPRKRQKPSLAGFLPVRFCSSAVEGADGHLWCRHPVRIILSTHKQVATRGFPPFKVLDFIPVHHQNGWSG